LKYFSTNKKSPVVTFKEATILGQASDKGLYFPEYIPQVDKHLLDNIVHLSNEEIAFSVIKPYVGETITDERLFQIVSETINFPMPLVFLNEQCASLELFHGPTLAFKDVGARFMSRCLGEFVRDKNEKVTVLVATSGDTGGAVASGFYNVEGVEVVILYPSGKVSPVQEKQLTAMGGNIQALEIFGAFDDCQRMVKQAFTDNEINQKRFLTSANSINVARWLPQQFYYFFAYKQWAQKQSEKKLVVSVPSGNFGNICAGLLAMQSGLPINKFIAACNANDVVNHYLKTGTWEERSAIATLSNAMDVAHPSNFVRILELFHHQFPQLKEKLIAYSISDEETLKTIADVYEKYKYILDPHGAVGYLALNKFLEKNPDSKGLFLETAHPVKFPDAVQNTIGVSLEVPEHIKYILDGEKKSILMKPDFDQLKSYLLQ